MGRIVEMINNKLFRLVITSLVCITLVITIVPRVKNIMELSERKAELEQQKLILVEKNKALTKELEEAESLENMERIAREQLGMVKNGEKIIMPVIPND